MKKWKMKPKIQANDHAECKCCNAGFDGCARVGDDVIVGVVVGDVVLEPGS